MVKDCEVVVTNPVLGTVGSDQTSQVQNVVARQLLPIFPLCQRRVTTPIEL